MSKRILAITGAGLTAVIMIAASMFAWSARASDVAAPVPTPGRDSVKYHVVGTSMDPTIQDGDWLVVSSSTATVRRGSIIILRYPKDETKIYCRRVIGVAGDKVVTKYYSNVKLTTVFSAEHPDGVVFPDRVAPMGQPYGEYDATVGPDQYFVVGDNAVPGGSFDSDEWGLLPAADVEGMVISREEPNPRTF